MGRAGDAARRPAVRHRPGAGLVKEAEPRAGIVAWGHGLSARKRHKALASLICCVSVRFVHRRGVNFDG